MKDRILGLKIVPNLTGTCLFAFLDYWKALKIKKRHTLCTTLDNFAKDVNRIN